MARATLYVRGTRVWLVPPGTELPEGDFVVRPAAGGLPVQVDEAALAPFETDAEGANAWQQDLLREQMTRLGALGEQLGRAMVAGQVAAASPAAAARMQAAVLGLRDAVASEGADAVANKVAEGLGGAAGADVGKTAVQLAEDAKRRR